MVATMGVEELHIIVAIEAVLIDDLGDLKGMAEGGDAVANTHTHYSSPPNIASQQAGQMPLMSISRSSVER